MLLYVCCGFIQWMLQALPLTVLCEEVLLDCPPLSVCVQLCVVRSVSSCILALAAGHRVRVFDVVRCCLY